jgi:thiosulfate/3-mercaptopyruvate sulfurtransferase
MLRFIGAALVGWLSIVSLSSAGQADGPVVDVAWMKANLGKPGVAVVDLRPAHSLYLAGHIPGAVYTDYAKSGWREKDKNGVEGMLPETPKVETLIGSLGIDNAAHVVLVPEGRNAADMGTATRVYWTFKVMGHDKISILDGGYLAWVKEIDKDKKPVNPLETADNKPTAKPFKAAFRQDMIVSKADVQKALVDKVPLIDNRPPDFYLGLSVSPAAKKPGTIPGAQSIPEAWLTKNNGGHFRSAPQLTSLYKTANVATSGAQINFCNTGHWASLGWFVSSELLGNKAVKMYDGSMAEWTQDASLPVEQKIKVD